MTVPIVELGIDSPHADAVKSLWRRNAKTLGFYPEGAWADSFANRQVLAAIGIDGKVQGYLLYRIARERAAIVHLCVDTGNRRAGVGGSLVTALVAQTRHLSGISLRCRRDYDAALFWPRVGFTALEERRGRGTGDTRLVTWWFDHGHASLFSVVDPARPRAIIDANVFFDIADDRCLESSALKAPWVSEFLDLCFTDELPNELQRQDDDSIRRKRRSQLTRLQQVVSNAGAFQSALGRLHTVLGKPGTIQDESDQRHLAHAIGAGVTYFVTRDGDLLDRGILLYEHFGLRVLRPIELLLNIDRLQREDLYQPARFRGTLMSLRRIGEHDWQQIAQQFVATPQGERRADFDARLQLGATPRGSSYAAVLTDAGGTVHALLACSSEEDVYVIHALRVGRTRESESTAPSVVRRCILDGLKTGARRIQITDQFIGGALRSALADFHFCPTAALFERPLIRGLQDPQRITEHLGSEVRTDAIRSLLQSVCPQCAQSTHAIETQLWPVKVQGSDLPTFVVPIQPRWALHLFDEELAAEQLFGADTRLAINTEAVYYRSAQPCGLVAPARILWYVSQGPMTIRATSMLDEVVIEPVKDVFRRFQRLGVYQWHDIFELAKSDIANSIMALRFSHTEMFERPVRLDTIRQILHEEMGTQPTLQSPVRVPTAAFERIFRASQAY